ncbi:MAG: hypothetical protein M3169_07385 [Candidatus Eremiobacteraeota bacterium]|nr:hypothetical protein [Candidatus Eremiobacteraeota bacterium]
MSARDHVLHRLRAFVDHDFSQWPEGGNHPLVRDIVAGAPDPIEAYSAVWQLVAEGVIVPGMGTGLRDPHGNHDFKAFPYFSITAHGRELLRA